MKKLVYVLVVVMVLFVVFVMAKNIIAKTAVSAAVKTMTGLKLDIKKMDIGLMGTYINIEGLTLFNPSGYQDKVMLDIPEVYVNYDLGSLFGGKPHLEALRLELKELVVVKNANGQLNLDTLKVVREKKQKKASTAKAAPAPMPDIQIDVLEFKIGKVIYKDYSMGPAPRVNTYNINIRERYTNVTNLSSLASIIIFKALMNTAIVNLTDFDVGSLSQGLTNTLKDATKTAESLFGDAAKIGQGAGGTAIGTAEKAAQDAAETVKKLLPFGNK